MKMTFSSSVVKGCAHDFQLITGSSDFSHFDRVHNTIPHVNYTASAMTSINLSADTLNSMNLIDCMSFSYPVTVVCSNYNVSSFSYPVTVVCSNYNVLWNHCAH